MTELPSGMLSGLCACVRLSAWGNTIERLPASVGAMTAVQEVWLNNNRLKDVPPEIGNCASLVRLWLNDNALTAVPADLARCEHLQELYLEGNEGVRELPAELAGVGALRRVSVGAGVVVGEGWGGRVVRG